MNFYAKNVFANFKIDFWCENETFGVNFKQDDATVMYYMSTYMYPKSYPKIWFAMPLGVLLHDQNEQKAPTICSSSSNDLK